MTYRMYTASGRSQDRCEMSVCRITSVKQVLGDYLHLHGGTRQHPNSALFTSAFKNLSLTTSLLSLVSLGLQVKEASALVSVKLQLLNDQ